MTTLHTIVCEHFRTILVFKITEERFGLQNQIWKSWYILCLVPLITVYLETERNKALLFGWLLYLLSSFGTSPEEFLKPTIISEKWEFLTMKQSPHHSKSLKFPPSNAESGNLTPRTGSILRTNVSGINLEMPVSEQDLRLERSSSFAPEVNGEKSLTSNIDHLATISSATSLSSRYIPPETTSTSREYLMQLYSIWPTQLTKSYRPHAKINPQATADNNLRTLKELYPSHTNLVKVRAAGVVIETVQHMGKSKPE